MKRTGPLDDELPVRQGAPEGAASRSAGRGPRSANAAAGQAPSPTWDSVRDELTRALDVALGANGLELGEIDRAEAARILREAESLVTRVSALRLRVVAAVDASRVREQTGDASTGALLARTTKGSGQAAARDTRLATDLGSGRCAGTRASLEAGAISPEKAGIVTRALDELPERVDAGGRVAVETYLLRQAEALEPRRLRDAARRALAAIEPDPRVVDVHEDAQVAAEEDRAWERAAFSIRDNDDGTMSGSFTVPALAGSVLRKVIDAMTAPRRLDAAGTRRHTGVRGPSSSLTPEERKVRELERIAERGRAFAQLLSHLPTDRLSGKAAVTLVVTMGLDVLRDGVARVAPSDTGHMVSAGEARRAACEAGIVPLVLGGDSVPLDLGHQRRCFSEGQRTALASVYDACAAEGCDRPFAWTELHHMRSWSAGGPTDLANAVPLCGHHHRLLHRADVEHSFTRDPRGGPRWSARIHRRT